jgi:hypothetical protein
MVPGVSGTGIGLCGPLKAPARLLIAPCWVSAIPSAINSSDSIAVIFFQ